MTPSWRSTPPPGRSMLVTVTPDRPPARAATARVRTAGLPVTLMTLVTMLVGVFWRTGAFVVPATPLLVFTLLAWAPLTLRLARPLPVLVTTVVVEAVQLITLSALVPGWQAANPIAAYQPVPLATTVAAFTLARTAARRRAWVPGLIAAAVLPVVAITADLHDATTYAATVVVMFNLVAIGTAIGALDAARRARHDREQAEQQARAVGLVADERLRIARELHDVLAHHLTLVNAQAGVAAYLLDTDPQAAAQALTGLTQHTRAALDEVRATVGLLRTPTDDQNATAPPAPTLHDLDRLVDDARTAGTPVELTVTGTPAALSARADLAGYRIVQEALTNARKHAPGAPVTVTVAWAPGSVDLTVTNPTPAHPHAPGTPGHGLIGVRERAASAGGAVGIGPVAPDRFQVHATLPTTSLPITTLPITTLPVDAPAAAGRTPAGGTIDGPTSDGVPPDARPTAPEAP